MRHAARDVVGPRGSFPAVGAADRYGSATARAVDAIRRAGWLPLPLDLDRLVRERRAPLSAASSPSFLSESRLYADGPGAAQSRRQMASGEDQVDRCCARAGYGSTCGPGLHQSVDEHPERDHQHDPREDDQHLLPRLIHPVDQRNERLPFGCSHGDILQVPRGDRNRLDEGASPHAICGRDPVTAAPATRGPAHRTRLGLTHSHVEPATSSPMSNSSVMPAPTCRSRIPPHRR